MSRLSPGGATVSPSRYVHCWYGDIRRRIGGKRYIPQQKSPMKDKSVGCPLGDGKSVGVAEHFPWPVGWAQIEYPKKRVFGKFDPLMETFLEYETICREPPPGHVFVGSLAEIDPRKVAEVVRRSRHKKQCLCDSFFVLSPKPIDAISLETCKA